MNFIRIAKTEPILPVWSTLLCAIGVSWIQGSTTPLELSLVGLVVVLQMVIGNTRHLRERLFPLARLHRKDLGAGRETVRLALLWVLALVPVLALASVWLVAAAVLSSAALYAPEGLPLALGFLRRKRNHRALSKELADSRYEVVVFIAGPREAAYQINQWLPVLERLPFRKAILTSSLGMVQGIDATEIPIYFARGFAQVERFLDSGPRIVLYPANPVDNARPLRQFRLQHFFINHGESDKAVNQSKLLMAYDKLLVGGPLAERRLREAGLPLRADQIVHVGRPQAELRLQSSPNREGAIRRVLYAPTWEGLGEAVDYGSVTDFGVQLVKKLLADSRYELKFKAHPFTGNRAARSRRALAEIRALMSPIPGSILGDGDSLHEAMNWSDVVLTDISSVLNEYLVTSKPIVLCNVRGFSAEVLARDFPSSAAAYALEDGPGIVELLDAISNEDPKREARRALRYDSLGDAEKSALERFETVLREHLS